MTRWNGADRAAVAIAMLIIAGTAAAPLLDQSGAIPPRDLCLSQRIAGVECPGCGMTRSVIALGQGDLSRALTLNWIAPSMLVLAMLHLAARGAKLVIPTLNLRIFDVASIATVIALLVIRTIQIWT